MHHWKATTFRTYVFTWTVDGQEKSRESVSQPALLQHMRVLAMQSERRRFSEHPDPKGTAPGVRREPDPPNRACVERSFTTIEQVTSPMSM